MRTKTKTIAVAGTLAACAALGSSGAQAAPPPHIEHGPAIVAGGPQDDQLRLDRPRRHEIVVKGGDGYDTLTFVGSGAAERFGLSVKNGQVRLTRDVGDVRVRLEGIERLDVDARGGADRFQVEDMTGAESLEVHPDLGEQDGADDSVTIDGSREQEQILLLGSADGMFVLGTPAFVQIEHPEPSDRLRVNGNRGDDLIGASSDIMRHTLDGGDGVDSVMGGPGDDVLIGGDDFDDIAGEGGDDVAYMGDDPDRFTWQPGDGSDVVEGGRGHDSMFFMGNDEAEAFDLSADGRRLRFTRDLGSIDMDLNDVEEIDTMALRGADTITVGDLRRTDVDQVGVNLAPSFGTADPDGAADRVVVTGTQRRDEIAVTGQNRAVDVTGLAAVVGITHAEPLDTLAIRTAGGDETVDSSGLAPGVIGLALE